MGSIWRAVAETVKTETGIDLAGATPKSVHGGDINSSYLLTSASGQQVFVKVNSREKHGMFEAEFLALEELAATNTLRIPRPYAVGIDEAGSFIAMEALTLSSSMAPGHQAAMGEQLAALHRHESSNGQFGWHRENVIGETPQRNPWTESWAGFFGEHRLRYQLELAESRYGTFYENGNRLIDLIPKFLDGREPRPRLLHGDLWGGNASFDELGAPVIYDPATYYGDRETDIAFTAMFGGFSADFYRAYEAAFPLDAGAARRKPLYNLYHVLNHYNLFGGGYGSQAGEIINRLVSRA